MTRGHRSGSGAEALEWGDLSALHRLRQIKEGQKAFRRDFQENWPGWLFSLVFHTGLVILSLFIVLGVPAIAPERPTISVGEEFLPSLEEQLPEMFNVGLVDPKFEDLPRLDVDKNAEDTGYLDEGKTGAPPYLSLGGKQRGLGDGFGGKGGLTGPFGGRVKTLNETGLDVVFVFDSTGSMGGVIAEAKVRIRQLMTLVHTYVPEARLGLVTYRDLREFDPVDYEYTVKAKQLSKDVTPLEAFLRGVDAYGGGDQPEAIYEALETAMHLNWNQGSTKVIILFGDAPPRPENDGLNRVYALCQQWRKKGGVLYCLDTSGKAYEGYKIMPEFKSMAEAGGGEASLLENPADLIRKLAVYMFGAEHEKDINGIVKEFFSGPKSVMIID